MTIAEVREKCKTLLSRFVPASGVPRDVLIVAVVVLASLFSFGLGYLAGEDAGQGSQSIQMTLEPSPTQATSPDTQSATGQVVASKNGTKYYLPSCSGADRISDANKVWFASAAAAATAGYTPAANCKGL